MTNLSPFFLVWNPNNQSPPRHRHDTLEDATAEARRLAELNAGQEFIVLAAVRSAKRSDPVTITNFDDIPF